MFSEELGEKERLDKRSVSPFIMLDTIYDVYAVLARSTHIEHPLTYKKNSHISYYEFASDMSDVAFNNEIARKYGDYDSN